MQRVSCCIEIWFKLSNKKSNYSVSSYLAEGTSRKSPKDRAHLTTVAYSSLMEVLNQLIITYELKYTDETTYTQTRAII